MSAKNKQAQAYIEAAEAFVKYVDQELTRKLTEIPEGVSLDGFVNVTRRRILTAYTLHVKASILYRALPQPQPNTYAATDDVFQALRVLEQHSEFFGPWQVME